MKKKCNDFYNKIWLKEWRYENKGRFVISGEPGVGKTSAMASLALNWTDNHGKIN